MPAFSPSIGRFGDVTARGNPISLWYKKHQRTAYLLGLLLVLVGVMAGAWWYWQSQYTAAAGGIFHEGMVGQPEHLNPLYSSDNPVDAELTPLIYRGLLKYDEHYHLQPDLASKFEVSEDGLTYTLEMGDSSWHDGSPVTAQDAAYTIKLTQDPAYKGPMSKSFTNVEVNVVDDHHLTLKLKAIYEPFAQNLTMGLLPQHLLKDIPASQLLTDQFNLAPVGTGPLKFQALTLASDGKTIDQLKFEPVNGYLESIVFDFYNNLDAALTDFKLGELQSLGASYTPSLDELQSFPGKQEEELTLDGQSYGLFFNTRSQVSKDLAVRQALAYAINKDQLIDQTMNGHAKALNGVYPSNSEFFSKRSETYPHSDQKAKETFDQVSTKPTELTLLIPDKELHKVVAERIKQSWDGLGIKTNIVAKTGAEINTMLNQHSGYDVVLLGEKFEPDPDRYTNWHSTQISPNGLNITGLENKRVDKALEDGRKTLNHDARKTAYDTFQFYLAKDAPVIWLYQPKYVYVWSNKVKGIEVKQLWTESDRFANVKDWYLKTQRRK